ncbi:ribbon-helix-helix domain-containing protein [Salinispora vitiensis]|uniref:ribbon-helix-helix domain-containing protein n=1 Tax=Salinispora vitiensis TaxID=999544 RepID=UPI00037494CF|nr:CopG family transcriptional regulator [Salinispora vitiensis]
MSKSCRGTSGGDELTDELIERLASEAEQGYDTTQLRPRRRGRPAVGSVPADVFYVWLDPDFQEALVTAASDAGISPSELTRRALRAYLQGPPE